MLLKYLYQQLCSHTKASTESNCQFIRRRVNMNVILLIREKITVVKKENKYHTRKQCWIRKQRNENSWKRFRQMPLNLQKLYILCEFLIRYYFAVYSSANGFCFCFFFPKYFFLCMTNNRTNIQLYYYLIYAISHARGRGKQWNI